MHLPHIFFEKQVCGKAGKRIISDLGVPSKHSNEKGQARGSGLMGFHILLREGKGWVQRAWNNVRQAQKHTQGLGVPSYPGHRQQQTRQDTSTKKAGLGSHESEAR